MTKAVIFIYTRSFNEPGVDSIDRYEVDDYQINDSVVEAKYCGEKLNDATKKVNKILTEDNELKEFNAE